MEKQHQPLRLRLERYVCIVALLMATLAWFTSTAQAGAPFSGMVNINTATAEELSLLPGVGPNKAKRILDHRARRPFRTIAELVRVKGFGTKTLTRLRPFLTVSGPSVTTGQGTAPPAAPTFASGQNNTTCPCRCDSKPTAPASNEPPRVSR